MPNSDQLLRTLGNLYAAVFEKGGGSTPNTPLIDVITNNESMPSMSESYGSYPPLPARYYAPLTLTGGTGITYNAGGTTASRVEYGKGIIATAQGWFAARFTPTWNGTDGVLHYVFAAQVDATHRIVLYKSTGNNWTIESHDGATNNTATIAATHTSGQTVTLVCAWIAGTIYISLNGSVFTTAARGTNPSFASLTTVDFFSLAAANPVNAAVLWAIMGEGTLVNADAATMHAWGATVPVYGTTLSFAQAYAWLVDWIWPAASSAHDPLSNRYGENSYA